MSATLERIEQTRDALLGALAGRDWETITELDLHCRVCVEAVSYTHLTLPTICSV